MRPPPAILVVILASLPGAVRAAVCPGQVEQAPQQLRLLVTELNGCEIDPYRAAVGAEPPAPAVRLLIEKVEQIEACSRASAGDAPTEEARALLDLAAYLPRLLRTPDPGPAPATLEAARAREPGHVCHHLCDRAAIYLDDRTLSAAISQGAALSWASLRRSLDGVRAPDPLGLANVSLLNGGASAWIDNPGLATLPDPLGSPPPPGFTVERFRVPAPSLDDDLGADAAWSRTYGFTSRGVRRSAFAAYGAAAAGFRDYGLYQYVGDVVTASIVEERLTLADFLARRRDGLGLLDSRRAPGLDIMLPRGVDIMAELARDPRRPELFRERTPFMNRTTGRILSSEFDVTLGATSFGWTSAGGVTDYRLSRRIGDDYRIGFDTTGGGTIELGGRAGPLSFLVERGAEVARNNLSLDAGGAQYQFSYDEDPFGERLSLARAWGGPGFERSIALEQEFGEFSSGGPRVRFSQDARDERGNGTSLGISAGDGILVSLDAAAPSLSEMPAVLTRAALNLFR